jgi:phosphoribosylformylglycinamidine synthase
MLSESQERMLLVADKPRAQEVLDVFAKWGLDASIVGTVTEKPNMVITQHGELVADIPNKSLTDDAPLYHRPVGVWKAPVPLDPPAWVLEELKKPRDYTADLKKLLASANICDKRWVFEQYDSMVQTNTVQGPGGEAGVMRIKGTGKSSGAARHPGVLGTLAGLVASSTPKGEATLSTNNQDAANPVVAPDSSHEFSDTVKGDRGLAMALAGNGRWTYLDPKLGAMHAVAEAARKVACTGATPVAATNCLNFGNPEKPEIMAQLSQAIDGIAEACNALGTPVTGGNVSLYNETKGEGIYPTPVLGVVGIIEDVTKAVPAAFQRAGDAVVLLMGSSSMPERKLDDMLRELGSSEFTKSNLGLLWGRPPILNLGDENALHRVLRRGAEEGLFHSAADISDGGMAVTLAKCSFPHKIGASLFPAAVTGRLKQAADLFNEYSSAIIVTCEPSAFERIEEITEEEVGSIFAQHIGTTGGDRLVIPFEDGEVDAPLAELRNVFSTALDSQLAAEVVTA